ncbi:hypothetical protein HFD88_003730 [Aspergillus terreus]|nr:hypothetical protein HFD88_003730 [Aspergillus terreus]
MDQKNLLTRQTSIHTIDTGGSGEDEKLARRHRRFDLNALLAAARQVTASDSKCVKLAKCVEGQHNKAFVLSMDTGEQLVARLPNPNAGPAFFTTASEVATRRFLGNILGVPIPHVHAWSCETSNPVGAEYIIEEKAPGIPLGHVWNQITKTTQLRIIDQIVDIERNISPSTFQGTAVSTTAQIWNASSDSPLSSFALGPITNPNFGGNERATMELDRDPWRTVTDYAVAIAKNELEWSRLHAKPRMNYHRSLDHPETPDDYISLLERYVAVAPYITSQTQDLPNRIAHPDLHLDNIFVDPDTNRITGIIDWQRASVSPTLFQRVSPQMLEVPRGEADERRQREKELLDYYCRAVKVADPLRWEVDDDPCASFKRRLLSLVPCCWENENMFSLRNTLIEAIARWDEVTGHRGVSCPISFTDKELLQHQDEMELIEGVSAVMRQLDDAGLIPFGGMVRREDYERARQVSNHFKQEFVELAEDDRQRELHARVWPYQ